MYIDRDMNSWFISGKYVWIDWKGNDKKLTRSTLYNINCYLLLKNYDYPIWIGSLKKVPINNSYSQDIDSVTIRKKCNQYNLNIMFKIQKCPVYKWQLYLGNNTTRLIEQIKISVSSCQIETLAKIDLGFKTKSYRWFDPSS